MMRRIRSILAMIFCVSVMAMEAQPATHQFEQLDSLQRIEERPVVVFLHAKWCTICHAMQSTTWQNEHVVKLLDQQFYFVEFDGETERTIYLDGQKFGYRPSGINTGMHELAEVLGREDGKVSFPTTIVMSADRELLFRHQAYLDAETLLELLKQVNRAREKRAKR